MHQAFLIKLKSILPETCRPYVVTDAGFKNPWFQAVLALGWDYIGRVRGKVNYDDGTGYKPITILFEMGSSTPKSLGELHLARDNPLKTNCYIYKQKLKGRHKLTTVGTVSKQKNDIAYSKSHHEPWLIASSLKGFTATRMVMNIYKLRMTIEL